MTQGITEITDLVTAADLGDTAHGIEGVIQKMGVDLGPQGVVLGFLQGQLHLVFLHQQRLHLVQHLVEGQAQLPNFIVAQLFHPQLCFAALNSPHGLHQPGQGPGNALGHHHGEKRKHHQHHHGDGYQRADDILLILQQQRRWN